MKSNSQQMSLAALAEAAGLPGRTIRFYITRGLLPGPLKAGRGAAYSTEHLERLRAIARLQAKGLTLSEIAQRLAGRAEKPLAATPVPCWQYDVAEDVVATVRADANPWRLKQIRHWLAQMAAALRPPNPN